MADANLPAFDSARKIIEPISELSDSAVLALADSTMEPSDDLRLSELLYRQQAELLSEPEHVELAQLMEVYQEGLLLKAEGLAEAVRRGLRPGHGVSAATQ